ncbi:hypothetical protein RJI07_03750 [Mycoplasmatota bacterium WC30]
MRKFDVFGKKINNSKPLYALTIVFLAVIVGYVVLLLYSTTKLSNIETENSQIQQNINILLLNEQSTTYRSIEELIPFLPNEFKQSTVYNEIVLTRNLSGLQAASNFSVDFTLDSENPFAENINGDLNYVKIRISFSTDDPELALDYIDNIILLDRLYYVQESTLNILSIDSTMVNIELFTFYISN